MISEHNSYKWITYFSFQIWTLYVIYKGADELLQLPICGKVTVKVENAFSQVIKISNHCEEDNNKVC